MAIFVAGKFLLGLLTIASTPVAGQTVREAPSPTIGENGAQRTTQPPPEMLPLGPKEFDPNNRETPPPLTSGQSDAVSDSAQHGPRRQDARQPDALTLADVIASLYRSYPEILRARQEPQRAGGELLEAYGNFDTRLEGQTLSQPAGNFENYRQQIGVARRTWWGGNLSAGYRIGRGEFEPWYKERETDEGGEFRIGLGMPLLQGRAIDPQRVAVFQASLSRNAAEPQILQAILDAALDASNLYWDWVATGAVLRAQRELLTLAEIRGEQYEAGVQAGRFAEIDLLLNQQLIAQRRGRVLETEQRYRATAFRLSLYLRGEAGEPRVPSDDWLPERFPAIDPPPQSNFQEDLANALSRRPEPRILQIEMQRIELDRRLARNNLLPRFDLVAEVSQDVGTPASTADNKGEFQLNVGFEGDIPLQRRNARGRIQSTSARIAQVNQQLRLQRDQIAVELQTAYNGLMLAGQIVEQAEAALRAAVETLERYRFAFERGNIDLIYLNLLETQANETEINLVEAQRRWFAALAEMQIALGLDPLEQASRVSALPLSTRPGPGNLPEADAWDPDDFERDWELHSTAPNGGGE